MITIPVTTEFGKNVFESVTTGNVGKFKKKKSGIRAYQQQMKLLLEKMTLQIAGNGEAQRKLQADLRNKKLAHEIDKFVIVENSQLNQLQNVQTLQRNE